VGLLKVILLTLRQEFLLTTTSESCREDFKRLIPLLHYLTADTFDLDNSFCTDTYSLLTITGFDLAVLHRKLLAFSPNTILVLLVLLVLWHCHFLFTPEASCAIMSFLTDQLVVVVFLFLSFLHGHGVGEPREFPYLHAFPVVVDHVPWILV
jgi:hypothetical protein